MRTLLYSPDSYGLGHVRRSVAVARAILAAFPGSSARLLTGAPRAHYFDYPDRCDYLKLPSVTKDVSGHYVSTDRDDSLAETIRLRGRLIREAVASFQPRLLLVDHNPLGLCGEILPMLRDLSRRRPQTLRVLGMRDIIDEPAAVKAAWQKQGVIDVLRRHYDLILVYGQRDLFDPVRAYGIPEDVARKLRFVGYIPRNGRKADPRELRSRLAPRTGRMVLVTLGGGGDGDVLLRDFLRGYEQLGAAPPFEVVAVTGPLMSPRKRKRFKAWADRLAGLTVLEYCPEMQDLIEAASFVVSMGGYNTVCESACAGARALIVPRTVPRKEQLVRASLLAERRAVRFLRPEQATPEALVRAVLEGLEAPRPAPGWGLEFTGLVRGVATLKRFLGVVPARGARRRSLPDAVA